MSNIFEKLGHQFFQTPPVAYGLGAAAFLISLLGIPTAWFAEIIIGLVTLRSGLGEGIKTAIYSALPFALVLIFLQHGSVLAIELYLIFWIIAFAGILRQTGNWNYLLIIAGVIAIAHVLVIQVLYPDIDQFWLQQFREYAKGSEFFANYTQEEKQLIFNTIAAYATGGITMLIIVSDMIIVLLARWWQAALFNPGGLRPELLNIRMPLSYALVLVLFYFGTFIWPVLFKDLFFAAIFPFVFAALSLIHAVVQMQGRGYLLLIMTYGLLVIFVFYMLHLLAIVGVVDSWYDFRQRIHNKRA